MKTIVLLSILIAASLISCEKNDPPQYYDPILIVADTIEYTYNDIEFYDSSTHILYFKSQQTNFELGKQSSFTFYADTIKIYQGSFWRGLSIYPQTPYVRSYPFYIYQSYALWFELLNTIVPDPRNDPRLISAFKYRGLLHSGLSVSIKNLSINQTQIQFSFVITNHDKSDLLILDHDKMGTNLFQYFSDGLRFRNKDTNRWYYSNIDPEQPPSLTYWSREWFSVLKSGKSNQYSITYYPDSPLPPGNYIAYFTFPGLLGFRVSLDQLQQPDGRIWLGYVKTSKSIVIQ